LNIDEFYADWLDKLGSEDEAAEHTAWFYYDQWSNVMHAPCEHCNSEYRKTYNSMMKKHDAWKTLYYKKYGYDRDDRDDDYDTCCTSGGICPCCGEHPD
jgi:hypothetical protein